ncbi:MAG: SDR family NAD(P)-dependent oxidoreductase [Anaerolineales bacterium]|jgi:NAD(P)-dependent dehydrogenase (short-subunit alcohol dehydrogenase family)
MFDFSKKVVMVSGASGNLGGAVVQAFQQAGASLIIPDRASGRMQSLFPQLAAEEHLLLENTDVIIPEDVQWLVSKALERFGRIDILVNTIGGFRSGKMLHETSIKDWDFMMDLNARSIFTICQAVLPAMLEQQSGKIVNIGARPALEAGPTDAAYSASKSAVLRLTESMAAAYKHQGINVNAVLPAALVTEADLVQDPKAGVTPEQVAQVILFLCSPEASIIHGAAIPAFGQRF